MWTVSEVDEFRKKVEERERRWKKTVERLKETNRVLSQQISTLTEDCRKAESARDEAEKELDSLRVRVHTAERKLSRVMKYVPDFGVSV